MAGKVVETDGIRVVRESFWVGHNLFSHGTTVRASHPVVKDYEQYFYPRDFVDVEWPEREV